MLRAFQHNFSTFAVASAPIHVFLWLLFPVFHTLFFRSHYLLSYMTIVETMVSSKNRKNPVAMTINNHGRENRRCRDRSSDLLFSSPATKALLPKHSCHHCSWGLVNSPDRTFEAHFVSWKKHRF